MQTDDLKRLAAEAWEEVKAHPNARLPRYLSAVLNVQMKSGEEKDKITLTHCPLCQGKDCSALLKQGDGTHIFKCFHASCSSGAVAMGIEKFIEHHQGCDWKQARRSLHELTGIPDPYQQQPQAERPASKRREPAPPPPEEPQEEIPAPVLITIPDLGRNIYEQAWAMLSLSEEHRAELRQKRGFDDAWITALGIRTSCRANREKLETLLDAVPPNDLLRSGIAVRDKRTWKLRIAESLCCGADRIRARTGPQNLPRHRRQQLSRPRTSEACQCLGTAALGTHSGHQNRAVERTEVGHLIQGCADDHAHRAEPLSRRAIGGSRRAAIGGSRRVNNRLRDGALTDDGALDAGALRV